MRQKVRRVKRLAFGTSEERCSPVQQPVPERWLARPQHVSQILQLRDVHQLNVPKEQRFREKEDPPEIRRGGGYQHPRSRLPKQNVRDPPGGRLAAIGRNSLDFRRVGVGDHVERLLREEPETRVFRHSRYQWRTSLRPTLTRLPTQHTGSPPSLHIKLTSQRGGFPNEMQ